MQLIAYYRYFLKGVIDAWSSEITSASGIQTTWSKMPLKAQHHQSHSKWTEAAKEKGTQN